MTGMTTRRLLSPTLTVLLVLALAAALVVASRGASRTALTNTASHRTTFTVVERPITDTTVDNGAPGDSVGDLLPFANPIYNSSNRRRLGTDEGSCTRTRVGVAYYCEWVLTLTKGAHRGRIVVAGSFFDDTSRTSVFVVTGGTGDFAHAAGPMRLTTRGDGNYTFRYSLTY